MVPADDALTIMAVGDIVPTRRLPAEADLSPGVRAVFDHLHGAHIVFGTLEAALTDRGEPCDKVVMYRAEPSIGPDIAAMGVDLVSLANNQTLNYGHAGLAQTIEVLDAHGIRHLGAGANAAEAWAPVVLRDRVAFIAFTCVAPAGWAATTDRPGLAAVRVRSAYEVDARWEAEEPGIAPRVRTWIDDAEMRLPLDAVRAARTLADVVIVSVHWGVGADTHRADYQEQLGRALIAAGASCVLGSHPPPLQGFELTARGLISYSQGTFIRQQPVAPHLADLYARMPRSGCLLKLYVGSHGPCAATVIPTMLDKTQISVVAGGADSAAILQQILERSQGLKKRMAVGDRSLHLDLRARGHAAPQPSDDGLAPTATAHGDTGRHLASAVDHGGDRA